MQYPNKTQQIPGCSPLLCLLLSVPLFPFLVGDFPLGKRLSRYQMGYNRDYQIPVQRKSWLTRHGELPIKISLFQPTVHLFTCLHQEKRQNPLFISPAGRAPYFIQLKKGRGNAMQMQYIWVTLVPPPERAGRPGRPSHLAIISTLFVGAWSHGYVVLSARPFHKVCASGRWTTAS